MRQKKLRKFKIENTPFQQITIPVGCEFLAVDYPGGLEIYLILWEPICHVETEKQNITIAMAGQDVPEQFVYVDKFTASHMTFYVFHAPERFPV